MRAGLPTDKWKTSVDDYVSAALKLLAGMRYGYNYEFPVPVDLDGELLNGSHRVACAIALGISDIPVVTENRRVWAPAWDDAWFAKHCPNAFVLGHVRNYNKEMLEQCSK